MYLKDTAGELKDEFYTKHDGKRVIRELIDFDLSNWLPGYVIYWDEK